MARWDAPKSRYQGYRGSRGGSPVLKILVALLAVAVAAAVIFALFFMGEYMEYTDEGPQFRPPWLSQEGGELVIPSDPVVIDGDSLVIEGPAPQASTEPRFSSRPAAAAPSPLRLVEVTPEELLEQDTTQKILSVGGNALSVEMKDEQGRLAWQSQTDLAAALRANAGDNAVAEAVNALDAQGELYLSARIQCFRDMAAYWGRVGILRDESGRVWYDGEGVCWSNPTSAAMTDYLAALCRELAAMGFDEIVLESPGYPDAGQVTELPWNEERPSELTVPVSAFLEKISAALAGTGVVLSVQTTEDALRGENRYSGVTAAMLARYAGRVWVYPALKEDTDYAAILTNAGMRDVKKNIVTRTVAGWASMK